MKPRLIASLAIGTALVLGTTGCSMISPQATTIDYSAAEGVNVYGSGPLDVRNAFIVANEDGSQGNLVAAIVNQTDVSHTLRIELGEGSSAIPLTLRVPANTTISLGADGEDPILVEDLDTPAGADIPGYFQSGDGEGVLVSVPVLDGELDYLAPLVPEESTSTFGG
ncbi:DNA modification methylase [Microbacterium sp. CFBP9034]|uniref:DNA modification methylase n=1 Tax=Microbacterium sp. CFBP9034 TaxID=3096540 RepID=UPI002A6A82C7|nr:DNA modification methylase [Microbacterium sp. CFBP9034]MDY0910826.1 DNA modification methylase [Microbacterium sp. CFBP9034]